MGVDHLDFIFRLEKQFEIKLPKRTFFDEVGDPSRRDVQLTAIHNYLCKWLTDQHRPIPHSCWHRIKLCAAQASGKPLKEVKPTSWLIHDLGFG